MYLVELHDDEATNAPEGTLAATIGKNGIDYLYQVEMHLHEHAADSRWRRAYVLQDRATVIAVWARPEDTPTERRTAIDALRHVGRIDNYSADWKPDFVYPNATNIITGHFGYDAESLAGATVWAAGKLVEDIATVVMLRGGRVYAAWERGSDGKPELIARAPKV